MNGEIRMEAIVKKKKADAKGGEASATESFSWEKAPCLTCAWAYVYGCRPQMRCCGKYGVKPGSVYYKGLDCQKYEGLKNLPKGIESRQK